MGERESKLNTQQKFISTFQLFVQKENWKNFIMRCNSWTTSQISHIYIIYIKFHQFKHYIHLNIPIYKKQEKLIHDFILYTRNFLHIMRSILNNENENIKNIFLIKTIHIKLMKQYISCFHPNILHIKFSWIHVMENNI